MANIIQRSYSGGEISPSLYARTDTTKYASGLRTMRNFYTRRDGGAQNRPGTSFACEVYDSSKTVRLIPFIFNQSQTYMIELSEDGFRVLYDGAPITIEGTNNPVTNITTGAQAVVTFFSSGMYPLTLAEGDQVIITGVVGLDNFNGRTFTLANQSGNSFDLRNNDGSAFSTVGLGSYVSGGTYDLIFRNSGTPYAEDDLADIKYSQSGDVLTLVHPSYPPQNITRATEQSWGVSDFYYGQYSRPTALGGSGAGGANTLKWTVTSVDESGEESGPATVYFTGFTITNITNAVNAVVTLSSAPSATTDFQNGDTVYMDYLFLSMPEMQGRYVTVISGAGTTTITIDVDSTEFSTFSGTGKLNTIMLFTTAGATPTSGSPATISWTPAFNFHNSGHRVLYYNIYKVSNGVFGYIGSKATSPFSDTGITPDITIGPPTSRYVINEQNDYPSTCSYLQQRLAFANCNNDTEVVHLSQLGRYSNFNTSNPIVDSDAVTFRMAGPQVNSVKHIVDIGAMAIFTEAGEFIAEGDGGIITPSAINLKQYSYNGSGDLRPIVLNGTAIYLQSRGSIVRGFGFDINIDGYKGSDLTTFSTHLFDGHEIVDWAYQQSPNSIIWAVRDDGVVLSLTYVQEQGILAWARHDFENGFVENVAAIPEGEEDSVYFVVRRTIDGNTVRYIERLNTRLVDEDSIEDNIFVDSALTYDGRNTSATTMTMSGSGWTSNDTLTLTASAAHFESDDVGDEIHIDRIDTDVTSDTYGEVIDTIRFEITGYTSTTVVTGRPHKTVAVNMRSTAFTSWAHAVDEAGGLWHLEGQNVSVFADGYVVGNPNNDDYDLYTVTDGSITLNKPYAVIHVGLPVTADFETLDLDVPGSQTAVDRKKLVKAVTVFLDKTRGGWVGPRPPPDEDTDYHGGLIEFKPRALEPYDDPADLKTGPYELSILPEWNSNGRIFIRQSDPLPISILAVSTIGDLPFGGG